MTRKNMGRTTHSRSQSRSHEIFPRSFVLFIVQSSKRIPRLGTVMKLLVKSDCDDFWAIFHEKRAYPFGVRELAPAFKASASRRISIGNRSIRNRFCGNMSNSWKLHPQSVTWCWTTPEKWPKRAQSGTSNFITVPNFTTSSGTGILHYNRVVVPPTCLSYLLVNSLTSSRYIWRDPSWMESIQTKRSSRDQLGCRSQRVGPG